MELISNETMVILFVLGIIFGMLFWIKESIIFLFICLFCFFSSAKIQVDLDKINNETERLENDFTLEEYKKEIEKLQKEINNND